MSVPPNIFTRNPTTDLLRRIGTCFLVHQNGALEFLESGEIARYVSNTMIPCSHLLNRGER